MSKKKFGTAHKMETNASEVQLAYRTQLKERFLSSPLPVEHLMCNFGLYMRSSVLVKILVINDLYERILDVPGVIMEFGTWWGQNLIFYENLRAIHEPFNKTRKIIGFDTFSGYTGFSGKDRPGEIFTEGGYSVVKNYKKYLKELIALHEGINVLGHIRNRHELIAGDVSKTAPEYFKQHPETTVALAYFDIGLYEPTKAALKSLLPHLVPGSVILLDEFSWAEAPGEAIAFKEVFQGVRYSIARSRLTAERAIVTLL